MLHINIDIRINTYYNITMIRKGDTKDANEFQGDVKAPERKRIRGDQSEWFTCKVEESRNW